MTSADTPNGEPPQARRHTGLVIAVVGMGIAILAMMVLLVLGFALGWGKKPEASSAASGERPAMSSPAASQVQPAAGPAGEPAALEIETPKESRLYTLAGDGARIALHIAAPTGDEIIVIDTAENRVISRIRLLPKGGPTPSP